MNLFFTAHFKKSLAGFSKEIDAKLQKQTDFLLENIRHHSLRAKKYDETKNIWQARVDDTIRFYFVIRDDSYVLLDIKKHPK